GAVNLGVVLARLDAQQTQLAALQAEVTRLRRPRRGLPRPTSARQGFRLLLVSVLLLSTVLVAAGPGALGLAGISQAADVGPVTLITPTRVLDTRPNAPGIVTTGFDATSGTAITAGP